jgi:hypothetical protein
MGTGIRELKANLSRHSRRIEAGERIDPLVASGTITPPVEDGDPLEGCPEIRLPRETATALIDSDRDEA